MYGDIQIKPRQHDCKGKVNKMDKYKEPQIFVINNKQIAERLNGEYFIAEGNLGIVRTVHYDQYEDSKYLNLEYNLVNNLHEYKILVIDLQTKNDIKVCENNEEPDGDPYLFKISYPQKEFTPMPLVMDIIGHRTGVECLKIIFAGSNYTEEYNIVEVVNQNQYSYPDQTQKNIYGIINASVKNKAGKRMKSENNMLSKLISNYVKEYKVVFNLPTKWNQELHKSVDDPNYIPLIRNQDDEIVSYIGYTPEVGYELLLPMCKNKDELVYKLLSQVLPEIIPDYFPESKEFEWIKNQEFLPQEIIECDVQKEKLQNELNAQIAKIEEEKKKILQKYKFLKDMLIETGEPLVNAVCEYLRWLGFSNVTAIDGSEDILREDIQIDDGDNLYIIEVKGIGGTSTDAECAQVAKHRRKREKENRDKEIIPIYIVNHQRYTRPSLRQNPPFSENQIDYAKNDERGLLTTWQMYKQYKLIEDNILSKEDTRKSLCKIGMITLIPETLKSIGKFEEYFKKPKAGILKLDNHVIKIGDDIWARKDEKWVRTKIVSMQLDDKDVDSASYGEVGIVTEKELEKGYEIFVNKL